MQFLTRFTILAVTAASVLLLAVRASANTLYTGFETAQDSITPTAFSASVSRSSLHVTEGEWSAHVNFDPGGHLLFSNRQPWRSASSLAFDIATDETKDLPLRVVIRAVNGAFTAHIILRPDRLAHVSIACDALSRGDLQAVDLGPYSIAGNGSPLLLSSVKEFEIGPDDGAAHSVYLDNVRLIQSEQGASLAIIDRFGQFIPTVWTGKVASDAELQVDAAREPLFLASANVPSGLDRYGGQPRVDLRQMPFFSVRKVRDHWRLVDPDGHPFFALGVSGVSIESGASRPAPASLFDPSVPEPARRNFYQANLETKYGENYPAVWTTLAGRRIRTWGFNTIGFASDDHVLPKAPRIVDAGSSSQIVGVHRLGPFADVFDPAFPAALKALFSPLSSHRTDEYIIGYTFDHALPWDQLQDSAFVLNAGGPAAAALKAIGAAAHPISPNLTTADMDAFQKAYADRYFRAIRDALNSVDRSHHLYLGCRFTSAPPAVVRSCAAIADVVTVDSFEPQPVEGLPAGLDKPVLVSAFGFSATDSGSPDPGPQPEPDQTTRATAYGRYLVAAAGNPLIVGCLWSRFIDEPVMNGSRPGSNLGLLAVTDRPFKELVAECARVNRGILRGDVETVASVPADAGHAQIPAGG